MYIFYWGILFVFYFYDICIYYSNKNNIIYVGFDMELLYFLDGC